MISTLTRAELTEELNRRISVTEKYPDLETAQIDAIICKLALAALDSEPVAYIFKHPAGRLLWSLTDKSNKGHDDVMPVYASPQPAPVVPEEMTPQQASRSYGGEVRGYRAGWNACRAAMLQELKKSAGTEATCRSNENVQVLHTKSPAQSDCCPAQNHISPEQNGDTPAQSQGWIQVSEQMPPSRHEVLVGRWWGEKPRWCCKWATYIPGHPDAQSSGWLIPGASWTPTHWMPLPAAPQGVIHG